MTLPALDFVLWAAGPVCNAALLYVLVRRKRAKQFSALAIWSLYSLVSAVALFMVYRSASDHAYNVAYWTVEAIDAVLQMAVVIQVANTVLRSTTQPRLRALMWLPFVAGSAALVLSLSVTPHAFSQAGVLEIRGQLFTSILISVVFTAILFISQRVGFHWRSHVMSVGYGLTAWSVASMTVDLLHGLWGRSLHFTGLEHARMAVYLTILLYWSWALWQNEPERELASPEMRKTVLQLTERLRYDLAEALTSREKESR